MDDVTNILLNVEKYYTEKIVTHGASPAGVDWNGKESQYKRFEQLVKIFPNPAMSMECNDLGCGHGEFLNFLFSRGFSGRYHGYDISREMIDFAKKEKREQKAPIEYSFSVGNSLEKCQYTVASGIFNVRCGVSNERWKEYILETIAMMDAFSTNGFAFNILTLYSEPVFMREHLYYADPCFFFDHCKKNYSRNVALLHDYELYEFTILVRK